jgi:hypothetical protein
VFTAPLHGNGSYSIVTGVFVPRQCPHILLVKVSLRKGKALGSEEEIRLRCGLCYGQRKEVTSRGFLMVFGGWEGGWLEA